MDENKELAIKRYVFFVMAIATVIGGFATGYILNAYLEWMQKRETMYFHMPRFTLESVIDTVTETRGQQCIVTSVLVIGLASFILFKLITKWKTHRSIKDKERNFSISWKGVYGTSMWMDEKAALKVFEKTDPDKTDGIILGKKDGSVIALPSKTKFNQNMAVFGGSGSGKSFGFARPYIMQAVKRGDSLFVTDPKSELYESMAKYLEKNGYEVKQLNLVNHENSDAWNVMAAIGQNETELAVMCDVIIKNTGGGKGDPFFDNCELNLLKAGVMHVQYTYEEDKRNLGEVYKLLLKDISELEQDFKDVKMSEPRYAPYQIFKKSSESMQASARVGLLTRLGVFQNKSVVDLTSENDIDIVQAGQKKCTYFCITSDQDSTFDFIAALFYSFAFIQLVKYADGHCKDGLPVKVKFVLDEFPNSVTRSALKRRSA